MPGYSYATLDVKDKIVVVLRYFPEDADQKTKGILARYADLRYKAMAARQHGAKAMIIVTGPNSPNAGALAPMTFDTALAGSGIVAVSVTGEIAKHLFAKSSKTLAEAQKSLDSANPHVAGFALDGVTATVHADVIREDSAGERTFVVRLRPGHFFGEQGIATGKPRNAHVVAAEPHQAQRLVQVLLALIQAILFQ